MSFFRRDHKIKAQQIKVFLAKHSYCFLMYILQERLFNARDVFKKLNMGIFLKGQNMKARYILLLLSAMSLTVILPLENCSAGSGNNYHSNENGYTLEFPNGWEQIPDNTVRAYVRQMRSKTGQSTIFFETAFQRKAKEGLWFQSPYAIVQVIKYSDFFPNWQPKENVFENFAKKMSGTDKIKVSDEAFEALSPTVRNLVKESTMGEVSYDRNHKFYTFSIEIERPNVENMIGQVIGHFGRYSIVQVMFYDLKSNWNQSEAERNLILGSCYLDPAFKYVPTDSSLGTSKRIETKSDKNAFTRILEAMGGGAIASLVVSFIIIGGLLLKGLLSNKKKGDSSSDSDQKG